jgi:hypothetical protein
MVGLYWIAKASGQSHKKTLLFSKVNKRSTGSPAVFHAK